MATSKHIIFFILAMLVSKWSLGQNVGINQTGSIPNASAGLDIDFNDKGVLIPRVALTATTDVTTIPVPATSLVVYNTATSGTTPNNVLPGFYYWNGIKWIALSGGTGGNDWGLKGNSGTVDGVNFIGTTDNVPLTIKVNNIKSGYIHPGWGLTFYGSQAGFNNVGSTANTAIGMYSLYTNTTGSGNTGIGYSSLYYNSTGTSNTGVGYASLYLNSTGFSNTALGNQSMMNNTTGFYNMGIGSSALSANTTGNSNAAAGAFAMMNNTTGNGNAAFGYGALPDNTTGSYNTAVGGSALRGNTTGSNNISIGSQNMWSNTTGQTNISIGNTAMFTNTIGSVNICIGNNSMSGVTSAYYNTIVGHESASGNGTENTTLGFRTLRFNTFGSQNTAVGTYSLELNSTGIRNSSFGMQSLNQNGTGSDNTASGYASLFSNTTGSENVAIGYSALYTNYTGNGNTAVGYRAMGENMNGYSNIAVGSFAGSFAQNISCAFIGTNSYTTIPRTNIVMLGCNISTAECTADNQVMIGNTAITQIRSQVTGITSYSDQRFKKQIKEDVSGLDFILKLKPVTYYEDPLELHKIWGTPDSLTNKINFEDIQKTRYIGFIAQEVEKAAKECGFNFPGIDIPENENEVYTLRYVDFIMPMVKSIQELSSQIKDLENKNNELLKMIDELKKTSTN